MAETNEPADPLVMLQQNLSEKYHGLIERTDDLAAAMARVPDEVADEETAGKVTDMLKLIAAAHKAAETARMSEKEPFRKMADAVHALFTNRMTKRLETMKETLTKRLNAFQQKKIDAARQAARDEEKRKAAEAEELQRKALETGDDKAMSAAAVAESQSLEARAEANKRPSELGQTRGDYGGLGTVALRWKGYVDDKDQLDLEKLRAHMNPTDLEKALNAAVRAGLRECRGARIVQEVNTVVR